MKIPTGSRPPFNKNFLISTLEDKAILQEGGHVRDLTSLTPQVGRKVYFPCSKGQH